ncbi:Amino acid adenylation [Apiospora kogelbergensis]|uniref:Amino acid adenylation n=1 Tax=Apiospora kogelbergensis TaxID=1337665 RepID=A0AAW0R9S9_9PEZI
MHAEKNSTGAHGGADMPPAQQEASSSEAVENPTFVPFSLLDPAVDADALIQDHGIDPGKTVDIFPCTPLQEGLFSLSLKQPGKFVMQKILNLSPDLNIKAFRDAWEAVCWDTPILRTRIIHDEATMGFLQVVVQEGVPWHEATDLGSYLEADQGRPMGIGQPLVRFGLVKNEEDVYVSFVWSIHHALYDGWSLRLTEALVSQVYSGRESPVNLAPPFQYFLKHIEDARTADADAFWKSTLDGCEGTVFPAARPSLQPAADTLVEHRILFPRLDTKSTDDTMGTWRFDSELHRYNSHPLLLDVELGSQEIIARASFDSRFIAQDGLRKLLSRLDRVLQQLTRADPGLTLAEVQMLDDAELTQLWDWNSVVPEPSKLSIAEIFQQVAQTYPSRPAICAWDGQLTYDELDKLSTALAAQLVHLGASRDEFIPLFFAKSMWASVAMLAVVKSGAAFCLVDPSLPSQRLDSIIQQIKPSLLLAGAENEHQGSELSFFGPDGTERVFPLASTGKLDRKALQAFGASFSAQEVSNSRADLTISKEVASTETEKEMQQIWAQVLEIEFSTIGLHDSLFSLGGDSIDAMKVVSRARRSGLALAVADIFQQRSLKQVAQVCTKVAHRPARIVTPYSLLSDVSDPRELEQYIAEQCQLSLTEIEDAYPCTALQEGLLTLTSRQQDGEYTLQATMELEPTIDLQRFQDAWEHVSESLNVLRTRIV